MVKKMKKTNVRFFAVVLLLALAFSLVACRTTEDETKKEPPGTPQFAVYLAEDDEKYEIVGENPVMVERGGVVRFTLKMKNDWCVSRITRQNAEVEAQIVNEYDGTTTVGITGIPYGMILSAECGVAESYISYYPNGGTYLDGNDSDEPFTVGVSFKNRLRPNTEVGTDRFTRRGYVQIGWNTKADGSGEHVGLGSRATVPVGESFALYAEWVKESPTEDFTFRKYGKGYTVTGYTGNDECVVLPTRYQGSAVYVLAGGVFKNNNTVKTVIVPPSYETIGDSAFENCSLEELYLFDNVDYIADGCFVNCPDFSTVHVNAVEAPRFGKNLFSEYNLADKYDILILNQNKQKLIAFGGSGTYMSLDTLQMEEELGAAGEDYICLNLAVNGWFNGAAQMQMIAHYLKEGDILLHMPESSSGFSLLYDVSMTPSTLEFDYNRLRFYYCIEANYDLFSLFDLRTVTDFFDGFSAFNDEREDMEETSYTDYKERVDWYGTEEYIRDLAYIDERGNLALPKLVNARTAGEADLVLEYLTDETANERLNGFYDSLAARGIKVFFSCTAINADTLEKRLASPEEFHRVSDDGSLYYGRPEGISDPDYASLAEWVEAYETEMNGRLHASILLSVSDVLYHTRNFFEPDYHLNDETTSIHTGKVTSALLAALRGGE